MVFKKGQKTWNSGLTKSDPRVKKYVDKFKEKMNCGI